mmetsp:Transcript_8190/g.17890  ORF Transcript_8190/g.17890 Transcript_8190/m.17890 type:complete len:236 (+) Transcript_8190:515-1222(+)
MPALRPASSEVVLTSSNCRDWIRASMFPSSTASKASSARIFISSRKYTSSSEECSCSLKRCLSWIGMCFQFTRSWSIESPQTRRWKSHASRWQLTSQYRSSQQREHIFAAPGAVQEVQADRSLGGTSCSSRVLLKLIVQLITVPPKLTTVSGFSLGFRKRERMNALSSRMVLVSRFTSPSTATPPREGPYSCTATFVSIILGSTREGAKYTRSWQGTPLKCTVLAVCCRCSMPGK